MWRKKKDNSSQFSQVWISSTATHYFTQASGKILLASMTLWYEVSFFVRHHRQLSRKKIVRFFLIPAPFHCTHISWLIKRKVFEACWPQGDIVCLLCRIIPISSESSFLGHHDYLEKERQQEGVSRRSVCGHQFWWGL